MSISEEEFAAIVNEVVARHGKVVKATVTGFGFVLKLKSRRTHYDVSAFFDPATGQWKWFDVYRGGTVPAIIREIRERISG